MSALPLAAARLSML